MNKIRFTDILFSRQRPIGTCLTLYCKNQKGFIKSLKDAKKIAAQDLAEEEFKNLFSHLDELQYSWTEYPAAFFVSINIKGVVSLPMDIDNVSVVSTSFHVKPLFKMLQRNIKVALLHFEETEALLYLLSFEGAILLDRFSCNQFADFSVIDRQLNSHLGSLKPLLLLSGQKSQKTIFRHQSQYGSLYPFDFSASSLRNLKQGEIKEVYDLLGPYFLASEKKWILRLEKASSEGRAEYDFNEILRMADEGKIKTLFVSEEIFDWGNIDCKNKSYTKYKVQMDSLDDDLLDDLAEIVFAKNGRIIVVPADMLPDGKTVAGIIRSKTEQYVQYKNRDKSIA